VTANSRQARERRGRVAESLVAWRLRFAGYRIAGRRASTPYGEIDLIALKGDIAAIVEVKARPESAPASNRSARASGGGSSTPRSGCSPGGPKWRKNA